MSSVYDLASLDIRRPNIFLLRARISNRDQGGTGIGLSLASALVRMHGGSIEVSSELGRGSEFRVKIPVA